MDINKFLTSLNKTYSKLHTTYEELFWISYMGDHSVDKRMNKAQKELDHFRANRELYTKVKSLIKIANGSQKKRLKAWTLFFGKHQTPEHLLKLKDKITELESKISKKESRRKEGYIDPKTKKFIKASKSKMGMTMRTNDDERTRKACFDALENFAKSNLDDYVKLVGMLNQYAEGLGFEDFYAYKVYTEEGMTKKELFTVFDKIYDETKYAFKDVRLMEKKIQGLRKPWNFSYMMTGDFTKEEDPYFQFDESLMRWGESFNALGIDYQKGALQLDLLDRKGKYSNGFCHWPKLVEYNKNKRLPGASNFTCNVVWGQVGSGVQGINTFFHEGGHAAHLLNSTQTEVCLNNEYPPASTAWDETQSIFLDSMSSSIVWRTRYAKNREGDNYPFSIFKRKVEKLNKITPLSMMGIMFVMNFEKDIYECKNLDIDKVLKIAKKSFKKYFDKSEDSLLALNVPHIYSWSSVCSYHAYGLAELAVSQWKDYFYKKYGYIVDNKKVGSEMQKVWKFGSAKTFKELVVLATKKRLSSKAYVNDITMNVEKSLKLAEKRIKRIEKIPRHKGKIKLNAKISMVHGKKEICNNKKSFEDMSSKYKVWLNSLKS